MKTVSEGIARSVQPVAPRTLEETGLTVELITDLILKSLYTTGDATGTELSRRLGLVFPTIEPILEYTKTHLLCEIVGGTLIGGSSYRYRLTDAGRVRAMSSLQRSYYSG